MQKLRTRDPDQEWLRERLRLQLQRDEKPTLLDDVAPEVALSLLSEELLAQAKQDQRTLSRRWSEYRFQLFDWTTTFLLFFCWPAGLYRLYVRKKQPPTTLFSVHTPRWRRLAELFAEKVGETRSAASVAELILVLRTLDSDRVGEEARLEVALSRRIAEVLPFLTPTELASLPEPCWEFLVYALEQRIEIEAIRRLPWMKAPFTIAVILALGSVKNPKVAPLMQRLAEHDTEGRVREAASDYLATP